MIRSLAYAAVRGVVRYSPFEGLRRLFWQRLAAPHFQGGHRFIARTRWGATIEGDAEDVLQRYIYYFGEWEPHATRWTASRLREGDVFVDVGANIGYYTLLASRLVGTTGRVIAIEASPTAFAALRTNVARNAATNVDLFNLAVSDVAGTLPVYAAPRGNRGQSAVFLRPGFTPEGDVEARPLAGIITPELRRRVRIIKIDVEGWEGAVAAGMSPLLDDARPDLEIVMEIWPESLRAGGWDAESLIDGLSTRGFRAYRLENDYLPLSYLSRQRVRSLEPLQRPIEGQVDVVFTRLDPREPHGHGGGRPRT